VDGSNQEWRKALWALVEQSGDNEYYGDTLRLLSMITLSGNWWAPEKAPCGGS
jgi:hypothetical protein